MSTDVTVTNRIEERNIKCEIKKNRMVLVYINEFNFVFIHCL